MPALDMSDRKANFAYEHVDSYAIWVHFGIHFGSVLAPFCDCQVGSNANSLRIGLKSAPSRLISKLNTFAEEFSYGIKHFHVTLASLWHHFGALWAYLEIISKWHWDHFWLIKMTLVQFGITFQSLWSHFGYTAVRLQKTFIFQTDLNGLIKCRRLT